MEGDESGNAPSFRMRVRDALERAESAYLKVLRAMILIIATLLIFYAAGLTAVSLYKVGQSPSSVQEKVATVAPEELTTAAAPPAPDAGDDSEPATNPAHRAAYDQFLRRYHQLFKTRFETFRQGEDRQLTLSEFDDNFVNSGTRLSAVNERTLNIGSDIADLRTLLQVMTQAAALPETKQRLLRYKRARKVSVCNNVQRTRTTYREGWDPYSTSCVNWYYDMGCSVRRQVQTPYTARVCNMRFPEGTQSHSQIFRAFQNEFYSLLNRRRANNVAEAEAERLGIIQDIAEGKLNLITALKIIAGFLVLMFFFLLIAIERHQRRGAGVVERQRNAAM